MRALLIALESRSDAEKIAAQLGLDVVSCVDRAALMRPCRLRRLLAEVQANHVLVYSEDWERERAPQLVELATALLPGATSEVYDAARDSVFPLHRATAARTLAILPLEVAAGAAQAAGAARRGRSALGGPPPATGRPGAILAVWPGSSAEGGAVTHASGILGAFRELGLTVAIASARPLPERLAAVADHAEVIPAPSRASRLTRDFEQLAANAPLVRAGARLLARLASANPVVYQRHRALTTAGARLAATEELPLVLEWNCSELWLRRHWDRPTPRARWLDESVAAMERRVLATSSVVAAVSTRAGEMALEMGASEDRVLVSPNAADVERIAGLADRAGEPEPGLVGWIGSFGPWHGAEIAVEALKHLPAAVRLRMIGDGKQREACELLARELGVADRIEWLGTVAHEEAIRMLSRCQVLIAPHVPAMQRPFFGSPTKLFEYMAIGRPIVASRLEQLAEVIDDGDTGVLVAPGDAPGLAAAVKVLVADPARGAALGRSARSEALAEHSWGHRAVALLDALTAPGQAPADR